MALALALGCACINPLAAQEDLLGAVTDSSQDGGLPEIPEIPGLQQPGEAEVPPTAEEIPEINAAPSPDQLAEDPSGAPFGPLEQQKKEMEETSEGYLIKDAGLNDIFQFLAKSAGRQYFHNLKINGPDYTVTGHLDDGNPLNQMEELAFMYGLSLHVKGNTIYALTQAQLSQLPSSEWHYHLRYLRPTDIEQIKELIRPMLTAGTGIVNFEPKTNTVIVIDTPSRIEAVQGLLHGIDKAKGQIIVETKILRINSSVGQKIGVNWATDLGNTGVGLTVAGQLANIFGLPTSDATAFGLTGENIVLSPVQLSGVLKALNEGGISNQVSNPTLITEDNEQATISIIDRIPIITSTTTPGGSTGTTTVTEEVRYKIDSSDKAITEDPDNHREIGISIAVTPTLLPDGTIRMKMRPRSAQISGYVEGQGVAGTSGNKYPQVTESMIETLARIPDGCSLVVGGFYGEIQSNAKNKVPLLGDIPVLNFFFKSKEAAKEQTSLVFIVTPTSYDPSSNAANLRAGNMIRSGTELPGDYDHVNPYNPGPAHEPNLKRTIRGMEPSEAPYYPREEEFPVYEQQTSYESQREALPEVKREKSKFNSVRRK
ncbi:MAG: secretin N-terminal domain-containing protein [Luteolibacter sp.]